MTKKNIRISIRTTVTGVIVISASLYLMAVCRNGLNNPYVESHWKKAQGKILNQNMELTGKKNIERKRRGFEQTINYEYEVGNVKYQSNSVSREGSVSPADYPEGKTIDVYYNPADPSDSILIRTKTPKQYLYGFMALCMAMIIIVLYYIIRDFRK